MFERQKSAADDTSRGRSSRRTAHPAARSEIKCDNIAFRLHFSKEVFDFSISARVGFLRSERGSHSFATGAARARIFIMNRAAKWIK